MISLSLLEGVVMLSARCRNILCRTMSLAMGSIFVTWHYKRPVSGQASHFEGACL